MSSDVRVVVPERRTMVGRLVMTAHVLRQPRKFNFALLFRNTRVLALDVNPGRTHRNLLTRQSVPGTHWQCWPSMEAEPDERILTFPVWLNCFLERANVVGKFRVRSPPWGVQLELLDGD